jgi:hypothetical protein
MDELPAGAVLGDAPGRLLHRLMVAEFEHHLACPKFCVRGMTNAKERIMLSRAKKVSCEVTKLPSVPQERVARFLTGPER